MVGGTFPSPSLCPVRFDVGGLIGIVKCVLVLPKRSICARTVGVEDMICWVNLDGLGEFFTVPRLAAATEGLAKGGDIHSGLEVFGEKGLVSLGLEGVCHDWCKGMKRDGEWNGREVVPGRARGSQIKAGFEVVVRTTKRRGRDVVQGGKEECSEVVWLRRDEVACVDRRG